MPLLRLAGKHCAIIGGTGTIGLPIAQAFAHQGAVVTLLGRSALRARPQLERALPAYEPVPGNESAPGAHRCLRLDVADPQDIERVFAGSNETEAAVGPVDVLVNCAGVAQTTLLKRTSDAELATVLDTNLLATMRVCKHVRIRQNGCIINVSSLMAIKGGLGATAYTASKAGILGFTRAFCREMSARSVRVNALLPGWVESPMWYQLKAQLKESLLKETPLHRVADPAEVADAAVFLASNEFANNCVLNLDGGLSAV